MSIAATAANSSATWASARPRCRSFSICPALASPSTSKRKQRLVVMFSPNGVVPALSGPTRRASKFTLKESLKPLEPFQTAR